ncbi:uncharacterized protein BP5553_01899 [Venustampulla echinocandica]|uniref:Fatty acid hydroxylase domain-containing protein n=1 Tax=Venustampulla echinocandica TaxID=2656787 RepID=A0A370U2B2_9HELO|nr:uncharacterized protein BP5553_01899 [Venustampulla echinocandica]RDL41920.1 hypothetical protein BP5553_01899 [Venustampulla echinocandica]
MDVLLSLPVLGYLLGPATFSTSLNLLFFYMVNLYVLLSAKLAFRNLADQKLKGSTLVLSQPALKVEVVGTLAIRALFFLAPSILFLLVDSAIPSLIVGIKRQGAAGLPTRTGGVKRSAKRAGPQWYRVIGLSIFNVLLATALQAGIELLFTKVLHARSALQVTTTLPLPWSIAKHVLRGLVLREVLQYYIHRFILHPRQPNYLSRRHQSYFHTITAPYSFAAHYDHPASYILFRFIPTYLPSVIFRSHLLTYLLTLSITTLEETVSSSGYSTIPGIMLGGVARRQDIHSKCRGKGNFGPLGILDWIHGTSIGGDVAEDVIDEAEKHNVKERGNDALENVKEGGKEGLRSWNTRRKSGKKA